jgi:hypothetical protein
VVEDRLHIGGGEAGDGDRVGDEAGDDRREHDVDRAELAEQIGAAVPWRARAWAQSSRMRRSRSLTGSSARGSGIACARSSTARGAGSGRQECISAAIERAMPRAVSSRGQ